MPRLPCSGRSFGSASWTRVNSRIIIYWNDRWTISETEVFRRQGFGHALGLGESPALVIIDFTNGFDDPAQFGGGNIRPAIAETAKLLIHCRALGIPVAHTRVVFAADGSDSNLLARKILPLATLTESNPASHIVPVLKPELGELVIKKRDPSAFFGTDFCAWLARRHVDTLLVTGCTTSGCVRATVVDALGYGFRPIVVTDAVGDRALGPHEASLFDMGQKYADLKSRAEIAAELDARRRLPAAE
ncbi:MAG: isochorismatase family protein [Alphaproteobacteria bacterium]|nr:isochorismatase family protein [Alphaproteobacteria bacterium]